MFLKPHQQMLIKFFDEYNIKIGQDKKRVAASRPTLAALPTRQNSK
jgi:hypothetical protein